MMVIIKLASSITFRRTFWWGGVKHSLAAIWIVRDFGAAVEMEAAGDLWRRVILWKCPEFSNSPGRDFFFFFKKRTGINGRHAHWKKIRRFDFDEENVEKRGKYLTRRIDSWPQEFHWTFIFGASWFIHSIVFEMNELIRWLKHRIVMKWIIF